MNGTSRSPGLARAAAIVAVLVAGTVPAAAQGRRPAGAAPARPGSDTAMVEVAPIRCWWRTSQGAIRIGEPFEVRLTCAVLETDSVQVVPDESRLAVVAVPLKPFEVLGGAHPADVRAGQRRFLQFLYTLRLIDAEAIGGDVSLPNLAITYRVQSRVADDATLAGRDFTYVMPGLPIHVLSLVPEDGVDIRDSADVGLERIEALRFRARLLDIGAFALLGTGLLLAVLSVAALARRVRATAAPGAGRLPEMRILRAAAAELGRIAGADGDGWTPSRIGAGHAALRLVAAVALRRAVSEQPLAPGAAPPEGRLAVRARLPGRAGAAIASAVTAADVGHALAAAHGLSAADRAGLEALASALAAFTAAQYARETAPEAAGLSFALEAGRAEAARLARGRAWPWPRAARGPEPRP